MAWIDYKKAYDMVPQSLINKLPQNENQENQASGIDSRKEKFSRSNGPKS